MKPGKMLRRVLALGLTSIIGLSAAGATVFAAEKTDMKYIDMYLVDGDKEFVTKNLEAIQKVADAYFNFDTRVDISEYKVPSSQANQFFQTILGLYPDLFFASYNSPYYTSGGYITRINLGYSMEENEAREQLKIFYDAADHYLELASGKLSKCNDDFSRALVLHDEIVLDVNYNATNATPYTLLVNKFGKCADYSRIYAYLMSQLGIYCEIIDSPTFSESPNMNHEWVKIKLGESYYHVDVTWDDPTPDTPGRAGHKYFLLSDNAINTLESGNHYGYQSIHAADNTKYDSYKYHDYDSKMCKLDSNTTTVYAINGSTGLVRYDYTRDTETTLVNITDRWSAGGNYYWVDKYSGLDQNNGILYYNTPDKIYSYDPLTGEKQVVYNNQYSNSLYGLRISNHKLYGYITASPNETGTMQYICDLPEEADPLVNESTISKTECWTREQIVVTGAASGGVGSYSYNYYYKKATAANWTKHSTGASATISFGSAVPYQVKVVATDSEGNEAEKIFDVNVKLSLANKSTVSAYNFSAGETVTVTGAAEGGVAPYTYEFYYKRDNASTFNKFGSGNTAALRPMSAGTFRIKTIVRDSTGNEVEKSFIIAADNALVNLSYVDKTDFKVGETITISGDAMGGTAPYSYSFYYRRSGAEAWNKFGSAEKALFKPQSVGTFEIRVVAADSEGNEEEKLFTLTATKGFANVSTVSKTAFDVGDTVAVKGASVGASGTVSYQFYYMRAGASSWTRFGSGASASFKPSSAGQFAIRIYATDSTGGRSIKNYVLTAYAPLVNNTTVSATSFKVGDTVTISGAASGGSGSYTYEMYYKRSNASTWTRFGGTSGKASFKPSSAGSFDIRVYAKDTAGHAKVKNFGLTAS